MKIGRPPRHSLRRPAARQRGAALLAAMITVTLVAALAAAAVWQQWRATEVESAERVRLQAAWVLIGGLDWSRLILREDARAGGADTLAEPWAVPLAETSLTSFLAADKNIASDTLEGLPQAYLSGRIIDAQSKLNVLDLVVNGKPVPSALAAFTKLFQLLNLPQAELSTMVANLQRTLAGSSIGLAIDAGTPGTANPNGNSTTGAGNGTGTGASAGTGTATAPSTIPAGANSSVGGSSDAQAPLLPQQTSQLVWLGLSPGTVAALAPYVTILPLRTPLNLNTASAEAIYASVPTLDLAGARRLVARRASSAFASVAAANQALGQATAQFVEGQHSVASRFFEVTGRLRIERNWVEEHSLLRRDGIDVRIVWRERGAGATPAPGSP